MQISSIKQTSNFNISFKRGLTPKIAQQIQETDVLKISKQLYESDINCDFKDNKIIAWSCQKIFEIIRDMNEKFGQKFALPKGIFVEDFSELNIDKYQNSDEIMYGLCNLIPTRLVKKSSEIVPSRTLFFNQNCPWDDIDFLSDLRFQSGQTSSDLFLYTFLHDFAHCAHEDRILKKYGSTKTREILNLASTFNPASNTFGNMPDLSTISSYAQESPMEAVAEDISRLICDSLDENLVLFKNPFANSPYIDNAGHQLMYFMKKNPKDILLRKYWDGKF